MKYISVAFLILIITGCATSQSALKFSEAPSPTAIKDHAILYIYREYAEPTAWSSYLEIDGKEVISLSQEGFTWIYVKKGIHNFKYAWPFLASMPDVEFNYSIKENETYAFEMSGSVTMSGVVFNTFSAIKPIKIEEAKNNMKKCCRYVPANN